MFDKLEQHHAQLQYCYGPPEVSGILRQNFQDFYVTEFLSFSPNGEGEHLYVYVEKCGLNTEQVARILARFSGISQKQVSFAGLKDKNATTRQWFSLHMPGLEDPDFSSFDHDGIVILDSKRHDKKLKIGAVAANQFKIVLRQLSGCEQNLTHRLQLIKTYGVPNYFGEQRFGHNGQNISQAHALLMNEKKVKNRHLRGILYSSARALLFNIWLDARLRNLNWPYVLEGDVMMLSGCRSHFTTPVVDDVLMSRIGLKDIGVAGPLYGRGPSKATTQALTFEQQTFSEYAPWLQGLEQHDLQRAYRPAILHPQDLQWEINNDDFTVMFKLQSGSYATSILRECVQYSDASQVRSVK